MSDIIKPADLKEIEATYNVLSNTPILEMLSEVYEYEISGKLIKEVIEVHDFELLEIKPVVMQFFTDPEEKKRLGNILTTKIHETFGGFYNSIAFAYNIKDQPIYYQERKNLKLRRLHVPIYIRDIIIRNSILNCVSSEEIEEYSFI
jgi:hypothetical protein